MLPSILKSRKINQFKLWLKKGYTATSPNFSLFRKCSCHGCWINIFSYHLFHRWSLFYSVRDYSVDIQSSYVYSRGLTGGGTGGQLPLTDFCRKDGSPLAPHYYLPLQFWVATYVPDTEWQMIGKKHLSLTSLCCKNYHCILHTSLTLMLIMVCSMDYGRPERKYTDRNFVDKCSQQVMHFDHEATY